MEYKIRKFEFSDVLRIGQIVGKREYTKDEFYMNIGGKKELHLNKLAWESPSIYTDSEGEEHYGFIPGDPFYDEIIKTFKSFPDVYRDKFNGGTIVRKNWVGSDNYDIIIKWYSEPKMVSFFFKKSYEYCV